MYELIIQMSLVKLTLFVSTLSMHDQHHHIPKSGLATVGLGEVQVPPIDAGGAYR